MSAKILCIKTRQPIEPPVKTAPSNGSMVYAVGVNGYDPDFNQNFWLETVCDSIDSARDQAQMLVAKMHDAFNPLLPIIESTGIAELPEQPCVLIATMPLASYATPAPTKSLKDRAKEFIDAWEAFSDAVRKLPEDNDIRDQWEWTDWDAAFAPYDIARDIIKA